MCIRDRVDVEIAKFLNKLIIFPEIVKSSDNSIQAKSVITSSRVRVGSRDRDSGGIGDVFFTFATKILNLITIVNEIKKEFIKKPRKEKIKIEDLTLIPRFNLSASRMGITQESVIHFNKVPFELLKIDSTVVRKNVEKPISEKLRASSFIVTPALAELITERFLVNDSFNPYLFNKVKELRIGLKDTILRKIQEKSITDGIKDTLSSSEKGFAWMRDEEYTKGAYFLQPYVATIPPGRSRQF